MKKWLYALFPVLAMVVGACGDDDDEPAASGSITVSAAASLRDSFSEIGEAFTAANPDTEVTFNFDSSSTLATQITEGAPADVFASADQENMARLMYLEAVEPEVETFARNQMVIVAKPNNPTGITGLSDLASAGVIALCGAEIPCGRYAAEVLGSAGVTIDESNVTRGQNVAATLTAVTHGDAVAALVYSTDALSAGDAVEVVEIPEDVNVIGVYPIGVLTSAGNAELAQAFMDFVLSDEGQAILARHGFLPRS